MSARGIPILTYHSIDGSGSVISLSSDLFARQMAFLAERKYTTLTFAEAAERLHRRADVPERAVVLTFDDGYRSVHSEAFPVLTRFGFTATIFLVSRFCGRHNDFPGAPRAAGRLPLMNWSEIAEVQTYGIECAAHTRTHPDLRQLSGSELEAEVGGSRADLEDRLGIEIRSFAYPYGHRNARVEEAVRRHYAAACTTRMRMARPGDRSHALGRLDIYYFRRPEMHLPLSGSLLDAYLGVRQILRDMRSIGRRLREARARIPSRTPGL
jgi:peptidoglycan/xylan/chitin deacetylase (PgdA/CDA1 family)